MATQSSTGFPDNLNWSGTDLTVKTLTEIDRTPTASVDLRGFEKTIFLDGSTTFDGQSTEQYRGGTFMAFEEQNFDIGAGGDILVLIKNTDGTMSRFFDTSSGSALLTVTPEQIHEHNTPTHLAVGSAYITSNAPNLASFIYIEMKLGSISPTR